MHVFVVGVAVVVLLVVVGAYVVVRPGVDGIILVDVVVVVVAVVIRVVGVCGGVCVAVAAVSVLYGLARVCVGVFVVLPVLAVAGCRVVVPFWCCVLCVAGSISGVVSL